MKKVAFYTLTILLALCSCSSEGEINEVEFWGITIPYKDVSKTKTYHLVEDLRDHLTEYFFIPPHYTLNPSSTSFFLFLTEFNNYLWNNKEAMALFKREDCVFVLMSTYQTNLKKGLNWDFGDYNAWRNLFFDLLMSSDMFMSEMNVTEKVQMMVMALEGYKVYKSYGSVAQHPFTIMISIMLSSNYPPFVEDVKPLLIELSSCSYGLKSVDFEEADGFINGTGYVKPNRNVEASDLIIRYAKQFINDNK